MAKYEFLGQKIESTHPMFYEWLATAYQKRERPLCLCTGQGIEMYIAKVGEKYIVKRMPNTGGEHAVDCESFETPLELSGKASLTESIKEDEESGMTAVKLDFPLTKVTMERSSPIAKGGEQNTVKTDPNKVGLRSLMHLLYEQAGFNRWSPNMQGKRNWYVFRKYVLEGAQSVIVKGEPIAKKLFMPASFRVDDAQQCEVAWRKWLKGLTAEGKKSPVGLLVAELKDYHRTGHGYQFVFKHMPFTQVFAEESVVKAMHKHFDWELSMMEELDDVHLLLIGTVILSGAGTPRIDQISVMLVNQHYLSFDNVDDMEAVDWLVGSHRKFIKSMRYNLKRTDVMACAMVTDLSEPVVLFVKPFDAPEGYEEMLENTLGDSKYATVVWDPVNDGQTLPVPPAGSDTSMLRSAPTDTNQQDADPTVAEYDEKEHEPIPNHEGDD